MFEQPPSIPNLDEAGEKQKIWNETLASMDRLVDGLGQHMDENIKECVAGFIVNGLNTDGSCGGHIEPDGLRFPFVYFEAPNKPKFRWVGEEELVQGILQKYNLKVYREIFSNDAAESELDEGLKKIYESRGEETVEYKEWKKHQDVQNQEISKLIQEINSSLGAAKIKTDPIYPGVKIVSSEYSDNEESVEKIESSQITFAEITDYLKQKFLNS